MKYLRIILGLAVLIAFTAVMATCAMGSELSWIQCKENAGHGQWESGSCSKEQEKGNWEVSEVTETIEVTSSGPKLELADTKAIGGEVRITCASTDVGWVGANSSGGISKFTIGECKFVEKKHGACEESKTVTGKAVDLPWASHLKEETSETGEIRNVIENGGSGAPGLKVECAVGGVLKVADECTGTTSELVEEEPAEETRGTIEEEAEGKSKEYKCSASEAKEKESGVVGGLDAIKARKGQLMGARHGYEVVGVPRNEMLPQGISVNLSEEAGANETEISSEIGETPITIKCRKGGTMGNLNDLQNLGIMRQEIKFENCTGTGLGPTCGVSPFVFKIAGRLVGSSAPLKEEFKPAGGAAMFGEVEITGTACPAVKYKVEGAQICELPRSGTPKREHEIACMLAGSSLTFEKVAAKMKMVQDVEAIAPRRWFAR